MSILDPAWRLLLGLWFGAALQQFLVMSPALRAAGRDGLGFTRALAARAGTGIFFAIVAFASVIVGVIATIADGAFNAPADHAAALAALVLSIVTLARGATANRVAEGRWLGAAKRDAPDALELLERAHRANRITAIVLGLAFVALAFA